MLLLYADDIDLTGDNKDPLTRFIALLAKEFDIKDLGPLRHYFLGLEVLLHAPYGLHLSKTKYVVDILKWTNIVDCNPCSTRIASCAQLSNQGDSLLTDPIEFCQLVGSHQYLPLTRPDTDFAVNSWLILVHYMSLLLSIFIVIVRALLNLGFSFGLSLVLHCYEGSLMLIELDVLIKKVDVSP